MTPDGLPQFARPPVIEIVGAVQFGALPKFGIPDIMGVGQAFQGYALRDLQPQLPPIYEAPPGQPEQAQVPQFFFGVGTQPPPRAMFFRADDRFVAQLQRDRIAINERRTAADACDPSSEHVWPELDRFAQLVQTTLVHDGAFGPSRPNVVELTYVNTITPAAGVWRAHRDLHRVLRVVSSVAGSRPFNQAERTVVQFSFPIWAADTFRGRLHVAVSPTYAPDHSPTFSMNLVSRRIVDAEESLAAAFDACHRDAVTAFVAVTTPRMHTIWERTR